MGERRVAKLFPDARFGVGDGPRALATGDLDGDGVLDVVTANTTSNDVSVLLGAGARIFGSETRYAVGDQPLSVTLVDVDADGALDLITANAWSDDVSIRLGIGDGNFGTETRLPASSFGAAPHDVAAADLDADGEVDLAIAN